jgi:hypothetical protein
MPDRSPVDPAELDLVSSALRADMGDLDTYFQVLTAKLVDSLGPMVSVEREGGLFHKEHPAKRITVDAGERQFVAQRERGRLHCTIAESVRGIVLRTHEVGVDEWLDALATYLTEAARRSAGARAALDNLLT